MSTVDNLRRQLTRAGVFTGLMLLASGCGGEGSVKAAPAPEPTPDPRYRISILNYVVGNKELSVQLPPNEDDYKNNENLTAALVEIGKHCFFDIADIKEVRKFVAGQSGNNPNILGPLIGARIGTRVCSSIPKSWEGNKDYPK